MSKKVIFSNQDIENIKKLYYEQKISLDDLSEIYGCSRTAIRNLFIKLNLDRRSKTEQFIKYSVNEHFFDNIDTADKAYCLGLWYADGCNRIERGDINIQLQIDDYSVLNSINNLVENTRPIKIYNVTNKKNHTKNYCELLIHSRYMCEQMNNYNFIPRKSLTLDFPYWMPQDLIPFMLRGYIDGDGWVQKYRIGFMSTDKFCLGVKQYFDSLGLECHIRDMKRHYNEHTKTFDINGRKNIIPFVKKMFSDGTIFMDRKVKRYIEYGFLDVTNNSLIA